MKCSNFIFVLTMALIVLSCSKDGSQEELSNDSSIVGEWKLTEIIRVSGTLTYEDTFGPTDTNLFLDAINYNDYQANISISPNEIAPSGSFGITVSADVFNGYETYSKDLDDILVFNAGSWSTNSNILLVNSGNETQTFQIVKIKDASMTISATINSEMDIYGEKSPFVIYFLFTFKKN